MPEHTADSRLAAEVVEMLASRYPGIRVTIAVHSRWSRRCITLTWEGFAGMLPEERFHSLVQAIPEEFRTSRLAGLIWLELSPGETLEEFLAYPRSEDVVGREGQIYAKLLDGKFFDNLRSAMGSTPESSCDRTFRQTISCLQQVKSTPTFTRDVKLTFIRHGAFCDCQVLATAQPALAELGAGAA